MPFRAGFPSHYSRFLLFAGSVRCVRLVVGSEPRSVVVEQPSGARPRTQTRRLPYLKFGSPPQVVPSCQSCHWASRSAGGSISRGGCSGRFLSPWFLFFCIFLSPCLCQPPSHHGEPMGITRIPALISPCKLARFMACYIDN